MAIDYVTISRTNRPQLGSQLIAAANRLKELRELVDGIVDAANRMNDGADYALFVSSFGLSLPAGVTAANVLTLMQNLQDILNSGTVEVTAADRLARLDEFQARLAGQ